MRKDRDAAVLLALEVYFQAAGCRFNLIKQMQVGEILNAMAVPEPCRYCGETTDDFRRHRKRCRKWKKAKLRGQVGKEDFPAYSREIRCRKHKTFRGVGLPVVVDNQLHDLLVLWIDRMHLREAPDTRIFEGIRWEHLLTMLKRIVGRDTMAKAKESGPIGSKAMRQYAATMILKKMARPHDAMRRIGGSEAMAKKHYQDQKENAYHKLTEKRMLLGTSSSEEDSSNSGNSEHGTSVSSLEEVSSDSTVSQPSDGDTDSDGEEEKQPKVKGKLAPGQRAKSSNIVHYSDSESSASSEDAEDPERPKGKGKSTPLQRTKSSKRYSSSSDDGSESEELSETITLPPPVESVPPATPIPYDSQPTVTGLTPEDEVPVEPEAEIPGQDDKEIGGTTPTSE